jgi:hypothetical protein
MYALVKRHVADFNKMESLYSELSRFTVEAPERTRASKYTISRMNLEI